MRWLKTKRSRIVAIFLAGMALVWLGYVAFGDNVVRAAYEGRSLHVLNEAISGRDVHPFEFYLELADILFFKSMSAIILISCVVYLVIIAVAASISSIRRIRANSCNLHKAILGRAALVALSIVVMIVALGVANRARVRQLRGYSEMTSSGHETRVFPHLSEDQLVNLGWAHTENNHPVSSYVEFAKEKANGVTRIGLFGCSFIEGLEAAPGHDVASFLQTEFRQSGFTDVEVVNFGVASYGVHQSILMWRYLGRDYDLDYAVFFPFRWHIHRDNTFLYDASSYGGVHARFVVDGARARLVRPASGDSRLNASRRYHAFFPSWRYLRYDAKLPSFLRIAGSGLVSRSGNPFYYVGRSEIREEVFKTYAALFAELGQDDGQFIVVANDETIYGLAKSIDASNVTFFRSFAAEEAASQFYWAPNGHFSALGNELRARELFRFMTGKSGCGPTLVCSSSPATRESGSVQPDPLHSYTRVTLAIDGQEVATVLPRVQRVAQDDPVPDTKPVVSLLQESDLGRTSFVPLPFMIHDGDQVSVCMDVDGVERSEVLGRLEATGGVVGRIRHVKGEPNIGPHGSVLFGEDDPLASVAVLTNGTVRRVSLRIDDSDFLVGRRGRGSRAISLLRRVILFRSAGQMLQRFQFVAVAGDIIEPRPVAGQHVRLAQIAPEGNVELAMIGISGEVTRLPTFLDYQVTDTDTMTPAKPYEHAITVE